MERFEQMLIAAKLQSKDSINYVVWNTLSCGGCQNYTAGLLQNGQLNESVKFIVPLSFVNEIDTASNQVFVDRQGIFDQYYFGVDNVGIVKVHNNEVFSIKNYQADEMDRLANDLSLD